MMILYVARHGETDYNLTGRYTGSTDVPLNQKGINQAEELARKLKYTRFDVVVSSPLLRAAKTAEIVCAELGMPYIIMKNFTERGAGVYEGLTRDEAQRKYPELWAKLSSRLIDDAPDGGETIRQVDTRVTEGLKQLCREYPDKKVLLICHAFVSRIINRYCTGLSFEDMHGFILNNCDVVEYEIK